ncbi:hypothetical protein KR093_001268 [Drosophila rubida]|uniref:ATPase family AAA domain-containing protein 5 n=1 Tax=Drosophila rubida TaxID=30044 RepID=A0AAD4JVK7_9MUSC|nr:hypothetical protein KR093_001268 [Drosophila rubida]
MTDVNCLTSEHTTTTTPLDEAAFTTPTKNVSPSATVATSPFVLRAPPSAKSKLILQNMEEVLNSVKQKHREKHKRKREEKRRAAMLAEAEAATPTATTVNGGHVQPLREKTARENGSKSAASPLKSSTPQTSIMKHFCKTEHKTKQATKTPATNVFELMMSARNRSMGANSNGQQSPEQTVEPTTTSAPTPQSKRKQMLQEWNERKGGAKRRMADEARGDYIELQLEQRAKRLKKMLTQPEVAQSKQETTVPNPAPNTAPNSAPVKRGRGRPRTRRPSADVESIVTAKTDDAETVEFLAKLASPTKKRDSLLGYFPKVISPKNAAAENTAIETPKRRPRNSKVLTDKPPVQQEEIGTTPSGRPRRSCAAKARYDYDLEPSPTKLKQTSSAVEAEDGIEIIDLDNSNPAITPKKLAPLFVRQLPKPSPDPTILRARREFLQSGVPDKIRQEQSRQRNFEQLYEENFELFPRIAHVGSEQSRVRATKANFKLRAEDIDELAARKSSIGSITSCTRSDFAGALPKRSLCWTPLPVVDNKRAMVKNWKNLFDRFPTFKCYNQMREKYKHFSAFDAAQDTQPMGESFVVTRRTRRSMEQQQKHLEQNDEPAKPPATAPNGELLFTEKYKPLLFEQVLVNLTPVQELRDFLANWNGNGGGGQRNSQDDSLDFGNDSSSLGINSNTMVLLGPCSSGKTNAVFALANDMNFNVLEVNAGMRRTGKKLMQELQEATQSHQIRKEAKAGAAPTQQLLQKLQLNGMKAKRQQGIEEDVRKSLILIEDADILFENTDAGFTDAIYTLAASSKRPVIIVATDPNCAHLQRLMQQNTIRFHAPNALNISRFLAVLALMEDCPIELDELISLYLYNQQNLRKTLMELQFFIQSGGDTHTTRLQQSQQLPSKSPSRSPSKSARLATLDGVHIHQRLYEFYTCAQNVQHYIPFPVNFRLLRLNLNELMRSSTLLQEQQSSTGVSRAGGKRKSRSPKKTWLSTATTAKTAVSTLANFYEHISTAALLEQEHSDGLQPHLGEELAHTLVEQAVTTCLAAKGYAYNLFDKSEERVCLADQLGSYCMRSSSSRALDYEPALRSICRSEKQRAGLERRSSRFYHYLRNCTVNNASNFATDLYDAACDVLQEQVESSTASGPA